MDYEIVIGLEVHVHMKTDSKMFCSCSTEFGAEPNTQTCPICLGMPGVLPVINEKAVELAVRCAIGLACKKIEGRNVFSRKHYYYPDLPKNFQISQYDLPLAEHGELKISENKTVKVKRVHMEEDAGKLVHSGGGIEGSTYSLVDLNRTGTPLLEIVTEPDISSPEEAYSYLTTLKKVLEYLDISDCDMEKGNLRCDANISLRKKGEPLGVKAELKNMNSFKAVQIALDHEVKRQAEMLDEGKKIAQETRLWDEKIGQTISMRSKEEAHDYRYFPEPDLAPVEISKEFIAEILKTMPELPEARKKRFIERYGLSEYDAGVLTSERGLADYFEECVKLCGAAKSAGNWIMTGLLGILNQKNMQIEGSRITPGNLAEMIKLIDNKTISGKMAKEIFSEMFETGKAAKEIISEKGMTQITDESEIEKIVLQAINDNPKAIADFRSGNQNAVTFLAGQVMKITKGKANPQLVNKIIKEKIS